MGTHLRICLLLLLSTLLAALALDQEKTTSYFGGDSTVYLHWVATQGNKYSQCRFLESSISTTDAPHGAAVHWRTNSTHVQIALAAQATGWVGFGLSENGGMRGADMLLFDVADDETVVDAHVLQELYPIQDDIQNWDLLNRTVEGGFIIVEVLRALNTGDPQDRIIVNDSINATFSATKVIMAWGSSEAWSYHGKNRSQGALRFFGDGKTEEQIFAKTIEESEGVLELRANNYSIPVTETTYARFCWDTNDLSALGVPMSESLHAIGIAPFVNKATKKYVHHFILRTTPFYQRGSSNTEPLSCDGYFEVDTVFAWAPGSEAFSFPEEVGAPLGTGGFTSFMLEIHYNNEDLDSNIALDSSGIRMYWTSKKRLYDAGILVVGDPLLRLIGDPVGDGLASAHFDCPSSCSSLLLDTPITVFRESIHMHKSGVSARNVVKRNGQAVHEAHINYFDFSHSGSLTVQQEPYQVMAGDSFHLTCFYQGDKGSNKTFGWGSDEEMCDVFMVYYPRKAILGLIPFYCQVNLELPTCSADYTGNELLSPAALNRSFGVPANSNAGEQAPVSVNTTQQSEGSSASSSPSRNWAEILAVLVLVSLFVS